MTPRQRAYREFLKTPFWLALTARKKAKVKKCQRCKSKAALQSHHTFYRGDWFDTKLKDLEVLCNICHRKEHGLYVPEDVTERSVFFWACGEFNKNIQAKGCGQDIPEEDDFDLDYLCEFARELEPEPAVDFQLGQCVNWYFFYRKPENIAEAERCRRELVEGKYRTLAAA